MNSSEDIRTAEGMKSFMSWLWNIDRQKYTLILFGNQEEITDELLADWRNSLSME